MIYLEASLAEAFFCWDVLQTGSSYLVNLPRSFLPTYPFAELGQEWYPAELRSRRSPSSPPPSPRPSANTPTIVMLMVLSQDCLDG